MRRHHEKHKNIKERQVSNRTIFFQRPNMKHSKYLRDDCSKEGRAEQTLDDALIIARRSWKVEQASVSVFRVEQYVFE